MKKVDVRETMGSDGTAEFILKKHGEKLQTKSISLKVSNTNVKQVQL